MKKKILIALILLVLSVTGFLVWKRSAGKGLRYAGTLEATEIDLPARLGTVIRSYQVKEGDAVKAGQTLVQLSCDDVRIDLETARNDFDRAQKLFRGGSMSREHFDHARSRRDASELRASWCRVAAPIDGTVLTVYHEDGEWVGPGAKLLTLADLRELWANLYLPQTALKSIRVGQAVTGMLPDDPSVSFPGKVVRISQEAEFTPKNVQTAEERTRLVYAVKVAFANPQGAQGVLKPGMSVDVELTTGN